MIARLRPHPRGLALALVVAVGLAPMAACSDDEPEEGEARFRVEGTAMIVRQDGEEERVRNDDVDVRVGDQLTLAEGTGRLELQDDRVLELRSSDGVEGDTVLVMGPIPVLEAGDLLVVAPEQLEVSADETKVRITGGAARVSRAAGVTVASYDADVHLDSGGQQRDFLPLREMQVPALGLPPDAPRPLEYNPADQWDRRFLGEAIDLGERLQALAEGYTRNLDDGEGRTVGFYELVLPALADEPDFTADLLDRRREPGETLVGAAIAVLGRRGTFTDRWRSVFAFRDEGAAWGLVALDQGVDRTPLLGAITDAVESSPLAIAPTRPRGSGSTPTTATSSGSPTPAVTTPTTRPSTSPTTTAPPVTVEEKSEGLLPPLLSPIVDPVTDLLAGLVHGLLGGLVK